MSSDKRSQPTLRHLDAEIDCIKKENSDLEKEIALCEIHRSELLEVQKKLKDIIFSEAEVLVTRDRWEIQSSE